MNVVVLEDAAEGDTAFIYAILDMRRDPLWIRGELRKRG